MITTTTLQNSLDTLKIDRNSINIMGNKFPLLIDDKGNFIEIKNIKLDESTSSKFTCQMWGLNFLYLTLLRSNDQFGTGNLRTKVIALLKKVTSKLSKSCVQEDIISLLQNIENEGTFVEDGILKIGDSF